MKKILKASFFSLLVMMIVVCGGGAVHHIDEYKGLMEFMTSKGYFVVVAEKYKKRRKEFRDLYQNSQSLRKRVTS